MMNTFTSMSCSTAVASSWQVITRLPSPATQTTSSSGLRDLRADRRGQAEAHRAEAAGVDPAARLRRSGSAGRVHIWCWPTSEVMIASPPVTSYSAWTMRCGGISPSLERLELQRPLLLPARAAAAHHSSMRRAVGLERAVLGGQLRQDALAVADDRDVRRHVLGDLGRVDVDVDELRPRRELGRACR